MTRPLSHEPPPRQDYSRPDPVQRAGEAEAAQGADLRARLEAAEAALRAGDALADAISRYLWGCTNESDPKLRPILDAYRAARKEKS